MAQVIGGPSFKFVKASHFIQADFKLIAYNEKPKQSKIQTNKQTLLSGKQGLKSLQTFRLTLRIILKAENREPWD